MTNRDRPLTQADLDQINRSFFEEPRHLVAETLPQSGLRKGWLWREIVEAAAFVIGFPVVVWLLLFI